MLEGYEIWQDVFCLHCEFKCCLVFPNAVRFVELLLELVMIFHDLFARTITQKAANVLLDFGEMESTLVRVLNLIALHSSDQ